MASNYIKLPIIIINQRLATNSSLVLHDREGIIGVTDTTSPRTLALPAANSVVPGFTYSIKDESGGAATNNITVVRAGADTVDGAAFYTINSNFGKVTLYSDGASKWFTI